MNLLINRDEIAQSLAKQILKRKLQSGNFSWDQLNRYINECRQTYRDTQHIVVDFNEVNNLINKEINRSKKQISSYYKSIKKSMIDWLIQNLDQLSLTKQELINLYLSDSAPNFTKCIGPQLTNNPHWIMSLEDAEPEQPIFIRNICNNEFLLQFCLENKHEFWFLDSGYTNFLLPKQKLWHRLVHNHLHHGNINISYPSDRLNQLPSLPCSWRKKGRTILVVESSDSYARIQGTTLDEWRNSVRDKLKNHTDRPIEFRSKKMSRKTRSTVFDLLNHSKEYYCVVSDSSSAAIESIWAGVPAFTLGRHITNSVSKNNLSDIEDPYKGDIEPWLRAISYNQFTFEELKNGTAINLIKQYGNL
jgi:hypothetical protein